MKKLTLIAATLFALGFTADAQVTSQAQQTLKLDLEDAIEIQFVTSNSVTGPIAELDFLNVSDYVNGKESDPYQLKVLSNRNFKVEVKAAGANFTYSGPNGSPVMPVNQVLKLMVSNNNTGGTVSPAYTSWGPVEAANQNLITGCVNGNDQNFTVTYKATPGFAYPAGEYETVITYTATQN